MTKSKRAITMDKAKAERAIKRALLGDAVVYDEEDTKQKKRIKRDNDGRPTVMTKQVLAKLEQAFKIDCDYGEACYYAGISTDTLSRYRKANPGFAEKIEGWKSHPVIAARTNIIHAVTNLKSIGDSWMFLRAKRKGEFAEQRNHQVDVNAVSIDELDAAARNGVVVEEKES